MTSDPRAPRAAKPPSRFRVVLGWLGAAGVFFVVSAVSMFGWALGHGIHCPHCNRPPDMEWWVGYFGVLNALLGLGFLCGVLSLVGAHRRDLRLCGVIAAVSAFFVFTGMPR